MDSKFDNFGGSGFMKEFLILWKVFKMDFGMFLPNLVMIFAGVQFLELVLEDYMHFRLCFGSHFWLELEGCYKCSIFLERKWGVFFCRFEGVVIEKWIMESIVEDGYNFSIGACRVKVVD